RIEVTELHFALKPSLYRTDLCGCDSLKFGLRGLVELLAARNAGLENVGIVELRPDDISIRRKLDLPCHCHRHPASPLRSIRSLRPPDLSLRRGHEKSFADQISRIMGFGHGKTANQNTSLGEDLNADDQCR